MLQWVEKALLDALIAFFQSPNQVIGILFLLVPGSGLIFFQWQKRKADKNVVIPGIFGVLLLIGYVCYAFERQNAYAVSFLSSVREIFETSRGVLPLPLGFEQLFSIFIGPAQTRFVYEEFLGTLVFTYLGFVLYHSIIEYRKSGSIMGEISLESLVGPKQARPKRSLSNELGSGDLATSDQIAKWTKPSGKSLDTVMHVADLRGSEGPLAKSAKFYIPNEERNRHMLTIAKTGGGKTSKMILPILYNDCMDPERSTICLDSKPEMWKNLAGMTRKYNPSKNIMLFNPLDKARSLSWNILSKIEDDTDAKLIANTVIMATDNPQSKSDSPFFRNNALAVLNAVMVGLLHDPNEKLTMPRVHELVQSGMKPLCDWLEQHPHSLRNTRSFIELARSGSQNADTIMSELGMRLSAWDLPVIRATTYLEELDLEKLVTEPTLFIIELRESELEMLRPLANVMVVEILRYLTKRAEQCPGVKLPRPVSLVIDEFASALGRIPDIHVKLNTLRSRNVSIVAAIQSIAQVKANYGDDADSVLAGFNTKIIIPTLDIQDAEWASKETGQMTIRFQTSSSGSNKKLTEWFASNNDGTQEQVQQRAVLTPDEIGRPVDNVSTFFLPNTPPFQGNLIPFYKIPEMLARITEFASDDNQLKLRSGPIPYEEKLPDAVAPGSGGGATGAGGLPAGISNTKGWSDDKIIQTLTDTKKKLDWDNTTGSARKWWEAFETENKHRMALVLRLAEELATRKATITEFFLAYVYSNTDNIQANLSYLDYTRLKKEEEKKKREAAEKAKAEAAAKAPPTDDKKVAAA